jgi:hypothetical protein
MHPDINIFKDFKQGIYAISHLPIKEQYFYVKAHKLVALEHFLAFWNDGKDRQPCRDILNAFYPPLEHNHEEQDGLPGLSAYVKLARKVF